MGWIKNRQLMRCSQVFLRWFFLHKAVTDVCPWQSSLPRGSSVCNSPLTHGSSSFWDLLKTPEGRWFPALNPCPEEVLGSAGSFHFQFWSIQHPTNTVLWAHLISESLLVTRVGKCDWQGTRTGKGLLVEASGGVRGSWALALLPQSSCLRLSFCGPSCSNAGTCLVFWISKSTPGATWSFRASFRWFALRNSIKGTTTIKE